MKSLFTLLVFGCSILASTFGASADVIATDVSIVLEDVVGTAAPITIVKTDAMVFCSTCTYAIVVADQPMLFERKEPLATIKPNIASPALDVPLWELRHYRTGIGKCATNFDTYAKTVAYRTARDGLIYA